MNTPIPTDDLSDRVLLRGMMIMSGMILGGAFCFFLYVIFGGT